MLEGPIADAEGTFAVAVADVERGFQVSVIVMPLPNGAETLDLIQPGWQKGFLKKTTRQKSAQRIKLAGLDAYRVIAALDVVGEETREVVGILTVADARSFTLGVTKPGSNIIDDPEVKAFVDSSRIVARPNAE